MEEYLDNSWLLSPVKLGVLNDGIYTNNFVRFIFNCESDVFVFGDSVFFKSVNDQSLYLLTFTENLGE